MTANTRVHALPGWSDGELVTPAQINALDVNASRAVSRASTATGTRVVPLAPRAQYDGSGNRLYSVSAPNGRLVTTNTAASLHIPFPDLPQGHSISEVKVHVAPAAAHGGQPAVLPSINVVYITASTGLASSLGSSTHTWSDVATYEAGFDLAVIGLAHTVAHGTLLYEAVLTLESGANSVTGLEFLDLRMKVTVNTAEGGPDFSFWV